MKKSTFHLLILFKQGHNTIPAQLGGRLVKKSTFHLLTLYIVLTLEEEHFSPCNIVKTRWQTNEEEQNIPLKSSEMCSSSSLCHLVVTKSCFDLVLKVSKGEKCSSSSVCPLVVTESCCVKIRSQHDSVTTKWHTDEEEHFSPSDTFQIRSQYNSGTTTWQTGDEEHFSPPDIFKTAFLPCFQNQMLSLEGGRLMKKSTFQLQTLSK